MKKLMMAAAIVCAAACVQAASVTWDVVVSEMDASYNPAVGTLILMTGDQSWNATFDAAGAASTSISGDQATGIFAKDTAWTATMNVVLDDGNTWTKDYAFTMPTISDDQTQAAGTFGTINDAIAAAFQTVDGTLPDSASAAANGWTQSVPEPTSGLLLLIGMAGLALKRKRA